MFKQQLQTRNSKTDLASTGNGIEIHNSVNSAKILSPSKKVAR